ncbi:MAG: hypothetical protein JWO06_2001 [Bacteroidota bacterium]|nr:hypothetical protein [Bacteroidota bacterium]
MKKRINSEDIDSAIQDILNSGSLLEREDLLPECKRIYELATGMKYKRGIGAINRIIADILMSLSRYAEARPYLDESVKILNSLTERDDLYFNVMMLQSQMLDACGNFDAAIKLNMAQMNEYKDQMGPGSYVGFCLNTGTAYYMKGLLYNSFHTYQKVLSNRDKFGHLRGFNLIWLGCGNVLRDMKLYDQSLEMNLAMLNEARLTTRELIELNKELAIVYAEGFGDFDNSKKYMDECLRLADLHNYTAIYARALGNWGMSLMLLGKYAEALPALTDDRVKKSIEGSKTDMVLLNNWITTCLLHIGSVKEAAKYLEQAEAWLKDDGLTLARVDHYDNCFLYHSLTKNYDEATRYYHLHKRESDETHRKEHQLQVQQLNAVIELERKEAELEIEKLQRSRAQREVEFAQQQNALMQTNIEQRNNLIDEFQKAIKRMELSDTRRKEIFKELHEKINTVRRSSIETAEYDTKFNATHQQQVQKLHGLYPAITPSEAKIAVMLFSGLSNKEIAAITLTTPRNIETQRLKLRKKLKLKTGEDLLERIRQVLHD